MLIGLPAEVKDGERRVALDPHAVATTVRAGHQVRVQAGAGEGAGFADAEYRKAGGEVVAAADDVWSADLVVKVKEPQPEEFGHFRPGLLLFAYLHLAAAHDLARALADAGVAAYAFETLTEGRGLPLLAPMSEIAGRTAPIAGASYLAAHRGGLRRVLIPKDNERELSEIPDNIKRVLEIVPVATVDEVLANALVSELSPIEWDEKAELEAAIAVSRVEEDEVPGVITH